MKPSFMRRRFGVFAARASVVLVGLTIASTMVCVGVGAQGCGECPPDIITVSTTSTSMVTLSAGSVAQ